MKSYSQIMFSCAAVLACAVLAACGGSSNSTGPTVKNIAGNWQIGGTLSNATLQETCTLSGAVVLAQTGSNFTGTVSGSRVDCTYPGGSSSGNADGAVTGGQISGASLSYQDQGCSYSGTISGDPTNRVAGPVSCTESSGGQSYVFTGTWQVTR